MIPGPCLDYYSSVFHFLDMYLEVAPMSDLYTHRILPRAKSRIRNAGREAGRVGTGGPQGNRPSRGYVE